MHAPALLLLLHGLAINQAVFTFECNGTACGLSIGLHVGAVNGRFRPARGADANIYAYFCDKGAITTKQITFFVKKKIGFRIASM